MGAAIQVTTETFEKEVLQADKPVLIDFWASWCGPCKMLMPIVEEIAETRTDIKVCKVNVDSEEKLARQFGIMSIPTLVIMKDGKAVDSIIGVRSKDEILEML